MGQTSFSAGDPNCAASAVIMDWPTDDRVYTESAEICNQPGGVPEEDVRCDWNLNGTPAKPRPISKSIALRLKKQLRYSVIRSRKSSWIKSTPIPLSFARF